MAKNGKNATPNALRKVRFVLPATESLDSDSENDDNCTADAKQPTKCVIQSKKDVSKVHGTACYVNGTLNFSNTDYKTMLANEALLVANTDAKPPITTKSKTSLISLISRNQFTNDGSATAQMKKISADQQYWNNAVNLRGILLPVSVENHSKSQKQFRRSRFGSCTAIMMKPTKYLTRTRTCLFGAKTKSNSSPNTLALPIATKKKPPPVPTSDDHNYFEKFSYKLAGTPASKLKKHSFSFCFDVDADADEHLYELNERALHIIATANAVTAAGDEQQKLEHHCSSENLHEILQIAHRWQSTTSDTTINCDKTMPHLQNDDSVELCALKKSEVKLLKSSSFSIGDRRNPVCLPPSRLKKMSIDQLPIVTTLLRASRNQDEDTLRFILSSVLAKGDYDEDVIAVDCSGRTALSYMCATNVTHFLEILLQVPGIDINKPDIELNRPLHYAAECGHLGAIRLLLSQNKLEIDAKNVFGFTPLMKAAIQGHTRCAKALLFAGASPHEIDYKRQLRAEQWAQFCGRHPCAALIEKYARSSVPDKDTKAAGNKDQVDKSVIKGRARANSALPSIPPKSSITTVKNSSDGGIRSKISKVFNFFPRDKSTSTNNNNNNTNNNNNGNGSSNFSQNYNNNPNSTTATKTELTSVYQKGLTKLSRSDGFLNKSIVRPLEVPKLEVTSPHNQELIRKYEKRYSLGNNENAKPPALPPRRNSKAIL